MPRIRWKQVIEGLFIWVFCFLMGRAVILKELAPFGVALFASVLPRKRNTAVYLVAAVLGFLSSGLNGFGLKYVLAVCAIFVYSQIPGVKPREWTALHAALSVFFSLILVNLAYCYAQGVLFYDLIIAGLESIIGFVMVYIFIPVIDLFMNVEIRRILSGQEIIGITVFSALLIVGFWEAALFGTVLKNIFSIVLILLFAYAGGAGMGAAMGCVMGLFLSMAAQPDIVLIGVFAVCGLMAGTFKDLGRLGAGFAFILANALMTFYINRSTMTILPFKEIIISICILLLIPRSWLEYIRQFSSFSIGCFSEGNQYMTRMKEVTVSRLEEFSHVFHKLAQVFSQISQNNVIKGKEGINKLLDLVANQVCTECALYRNCWKRNFYSTYNNMFELMSIAETKGGIHKEEISDDIFKGCLRIDDIIDVLNEVYEAYRINYRWQQKIDECRGLVAQQLEGVSRVVTQLAQELNIDIRFKKDLEDIILLELDKKGVRIKGVVVIEKPNKKLEVNIIKKSCGGRRECTRIIEKTVSDVLKKPMSCKYDECGFCAQKECTLRFVESQRYKVITGIARKPSQYADICGDNYSSIPIDDGKYLLALSDGMGSGSKADAESGIVVSLLENFLEAGFDLDMTIKTINSILILRSREEIFATADLCVIDLVTANADFIKIGAVSTFIKRKDGVKVIKAPALPMGILEEVQVENVKEVLEDGDMIVMVTDGVLDSINPEADQDDWILDVVSKFDTRNPQELADYIMEEALKQADGVARDDMTVMVSRIWKPHFS
jgi:stage II sporulation protein E